MTPLLVGVVLATIISVLANLSGFDRERSFYPTVLVVVGSYYDLFGVMGGSSRALAIESVFVVVFVLLAYLAFRYSPWLAVVGLVGHGLFDLVHPHVVQNPGVPVWWPSFCMAYDVMAGVILAFILVRRQRAAKVPIGSGRASA